ncbi:unnamed protein product, partial [Vitis vinifera]
MASNSRSGVSLQRYFSSFASYYAFCLRCWLCVIAKGSPEFIPVQTAKRTDQ